MKYKPKKFYSNLTDERIGAGSYFKVTKAPATASISLKLGSNDIDPLDFDPNEGAEFEHQDNIYLTISGLLAGEFVEIVFADGNFRIFNESSTSLVGSYESAALTQLDKIMNPHQDPAITIGNSSATTLTTMLSKTLTCDKIHIKFQGGINPSVTCRQWGYIAIFIDGSEVSYNGGAGMTASGYVSVTDGEYMLENCSGKLLEIKCLNTVDYNSMYTLKEYALKA